MGSHGLSPQPNVPLHVPAAAASPGMRVQWGSPIGDRRQLPPVLPSELPDLLRCPYGCHVCAEVHTLLGFAWNNLVVSRLNPSLAAGRWGTLPIWPSCRDYTRNRAQAAVSNVQPANDTGDQKTS